jgi:hypothetical protein
MALGTAKTASQRCASHDKPRRRARLFILAVVCCAAIFALPNSASRAHFWYPKKCCNDQDCFRAVSIKRLPDGRLAITASHFTVIVPSGFPIRPSLDSDSHICVYRNISGQYLPRCVFMPGMS